MEKSEPSRCPRPAPVSPFDKQRRRARDPPCGGDEKDHRRQPQRIGRESIRGAIEHRQNGDATGSRCAENDQESIEECLGGRRTDPADTPDEHELESAKR